MSRINNNWLLHVSLKSSMCSTWRTRCVEFTASVSGVRTTLSFTIDLTTASSFLYKTPRLTSTLQWSFFNYPPEIICDFFWRNHFFDKSGNMCCCVGIIRAYPKSIRQYNWDNRWYRCFMGLSRDLSPPTPSIIHKSLGELFQQMTR